MSGSPEQSGEYDVVIVGAGTAGCLLANRLSADPQCRVALLEAGGRDDYIWIRVPVGYLYCIGNPRTDWCFSTEPEAGLNGRSIRYPRGKVLGGCSSINGMIYMRGQREDYDGWRDGDGFGANPGWGWDDVLPHFLRHEDFYAGADALHGAGREWRIEKPRVRWDILDAFRAAAAEQGIPPSDDFNRGDNFGCGYFDVNQRRGVRWNAARAFLRPVQSRPNLTVLTDTRAERLAFDGRRCTGVDVVRGGRTVRIAARREVILAAGRGRVAAAAAAVRHRAGGAAAVARRAGAARPARRRRQSAGSPAAAHGVQGAGRANAQHAGEQSAREARHGAAVSVTRSGPLTMSPSQLGAFASSDPQQARPNVEYHVQPLSLEKFGEPLHPFPAFTASVCNLRPTSRGSITARSADPADAPKIAPNYLSTEEDRQVAVAALRLTRRIVGSSALARFQPREFLPGPDHESDDALARAAGEIGTTIFHPVGTAKMGPAADPAAVVDSALRVHGIGGLRVIDASIMPTITSGNTNAPTLMIAEKGAQLVAGALRSAV